VPCYKPLSGYVAQGGGFVFTRKVSTGRLMEVPCGRCIGCRLEKSRQWSIRIMHEASMHEDNSFLTLTYDPAKLPQGGTLVREHFQSFIKRLRARLSPLLIRFFQCGEYGDEFLRPHHHAIIFGYSFPDKVFHDMSHGERIFKSDLLVDVWRHGFCSIGELTIRSAGYVARYCVKKISGSAADDHYWRSDSVTGEASRVIPEYATMSLRPGIGETWFKKFTSDVFPRDEVVFEGRFCKVPKYYDVLYERMDPEGFLVIKRKRILAAQDRGVDSTPERLEVREIVQELAAVRLTRSFENEA